MNEEVIGLLECIEYAENGACYICHSLRPEHLEHCPLNQALTILRQQPTAGEFTKALRVWYGKNLTSPEEMAKYQRTLEQSWVKSMNELREACDHIDRQADESNINKES